MATTHGFTIKEYTDSDERIMKAGKHDRNKKNRVFNDRYSFEKSRGPYAIPG